MDALTTADDPAATVNDTVAACVGGDVVDLDEQRWIVAARCGRRDAFEHLYRRHATTVHALCRRLCGRTDRAEDLVQEVFITAWRRLATFESRSRFSTWLHRIAVNAALTHERRGASRIPDGGVPGVFVEPAEPDTAPPLDLEAAIAQLPDGARYVLVLVGLYGHSHEEAAAMLGITVGTSKTQLHRARQTLIDRLGLESPE